MGLTTYHFQLLPIPYSAGPSTMRVEPVGVITNRGVLEQLLSTPNYEMWGIGLKKGMERTSVGLVQLCLSLERKRKRKRKFLEQGKSAGNVFL